MSFGETISLYWEGNAPDGLDVIARAIVLMKTWDHGVPLKDFLAESRHIETEVDYWLEILNGNDTRYWDERRCDMARISQTWPETTFEITIRNEQEEQYAKEHYRGGKLQALTGTVVYPPFDPDQLETPEMPGEMPGFIYRGVMTYRQEKGCYLAPITQDADHKMQRHRHLRGFPTDLEGRQDLEREIDRIMDADPEHITRARSTIEEAEIRVKAAITAEIDKVKNSSPTQETREVIDRMSHILSQIKYN